MKKKTKGQMDLSDRIVIEVGLHSGRSFKYIAKQLGRHPSTIAHEVNTNKMEIRPMFFHDNDCRRSRQCISARKHLCGDMNCKHICSRCAQYNCHDLCSSYVPRRCSKIEKPPYVCNNCSEKKLCTHRRYVYSAKHAQAYYERRRSESRQGLRISEAEKKKLDELITKFINQGQPLAHIYAEHQEEIPVTLRSLYNYIDAGELTIKNIDLRRKTTYRKRRRSKNRKPVYTTNCRVGRTYEDFTKYMEDKDLDIVVEMDTVIGRKGSENRILTMLFRKNSVMLMFLLPNGKAESVKNIFDTLESCLGYEVFRTLFPVILTDNGSEFKRVDGLEKSDFAKQRTHIFYCDPQAAWQKARIEKNHEYIRYAIPKGKSLNGYTQSEITLLVNHINSIKRPGLNYQSPYDLAADDENMQILMKLLKMHPIPPDEVRINPDIFKQI